MHWPTHLLTIDYETYWADDYTLSEMSTEEYVRDSRFISHGAAVKYGKEPARWRSHNELCSLVEQVPWDETAVLCQHAQFDGLILAHHYGKCPALWLDTLSMARMALPRQKHSLAALSQHFGLKAKGTAVNLSKNLRVLPPEILAALGAYSCDDADNTYDAFLRLLPSIPPEELEIIDLTIRLFTEPRLRLDKSRARKLLAQTIRRKRSALQRLEVKKEELSSTDKFAALLEERFGIDVEMKAGKPKPDGTPKPIPALAKTDAFMKSLLEHENADVQALATTRLAVKSTLEEKRLYRLLSMHERGPLCVYLRFAGAHTMRWSGGDGINWQNFTRGAEVRRCIVAPEGHVLVVADLSQIEARILNCLAEQWDILELFEKGDPYSEMAAAVYERPINKKDNPGERQVGKVLELGCGYGMGGPKLRGTLRVGALGGAPVIVDLETAKRYVTTYRKRHPKVVEYWGQAETALQLLDARVENYPWGPMLIDRGKIILPNGAALDYTGLAREDGEWRMYNRAGKLMVNQHGAPIRLYGGLMTENVDQALARVVMSQAMVPIRARYPLVTTTHDELVACVRKEEADEALAFMIESLTKRPSWLPRIPLAAEGGYDVCYSK